MSAGGTRKRERPPTATGIAVLRPDAGPSWLRPLVDNVSQIPDAYRRRLPADASDGDGRRGCVGNDIVAPGSPRGGSAVFWPEAGPGDGVPGRRDLLLTVRASTATMPARRLFSWRGRPCRRSGRWPPPCVRRTKKPGLTRPGCTAGHHGADVHSRRGSMLSRCWRTRRIRRWPSSTRPKRRSSRGYRCAFINLGPIGSWCRCPHTRRWAGPAFLLTRCWYGASLAR